MKPRPSGDAACKGAHMFVMQSITAGTNDNAVWCHRLSFFSNDKGACFPSSAECACDLLLNDLVWPSRWSRKCSLKNKLLHSSRNNTAGCTNRLYKIFSVIECSSFSTSASYRVRDELGSRKMSSLTERLQNSYHIITFHGSLHRQLQTSDSEVLKHGSAVWAFILVLQCWNQQPHVESYLSSCIINSHFLLCSINRDEWWMGLR